jgi:hypothetical protein
VPGALHRAIQRSRQTRIVLLSSARQEIDDGVQRLDAAGREHIINQLLEEQTRESFANGHGGVSCDRGGNPSLSPARHLPLSIVAVGWAGCKEFSNCFRRSPQRK